VSQSFQSSVSQAVLSGEVCSFRIHIRSTESKADGELFQLFREYRSSLRDDVEARVKKEMGEQFEVRKFDVEPGSVEVILVIGTAYVVVSRYKNFIESINLLLSQLKSMFSNFAVAHSRAPIEVAGNWSPGAALVNIEATSSKPSYDYNIVLLILLFYFVLSHAALLSVIIYQILKK
jgi:hypothetical protein